MFRTVNIEDAVGLILAHDVTEVRRGEFKGRAFKKGHVVRESDLCHLQRLGKQRLFVLDIDDNCMHENDAAVLLADALCGEGVVREAEPREGIHLEHRDAPPPREMPRAGQVHRSRTRFCSELLGQVCHRAAATSLQFDKRHELGAIEEGHIQAAIRGPLVSRVAPRLHLV